jgi:organic hydroperoxide reductase OsmC/OhrA
MAVLAYHAVLTWTGNRGSGTSGYRDYGREHEVTAGGAAPIPGTADPAFRGDPDRWNPEQLLVVALAQCHMLTYLRLCATSGIVVTRYVDRPRGTVLTSGAGGRFTEVVLAPVVAVRDPAMVAAATTLHDEAHRACLVTNSVNFPVRHQPAVAVDVDPRREPAVSRSRRG